jgi:hypothetical protein
MKLVSRGIGTLAQSAWLATHESASRALVSRFGLHVLPQKVSDEAGDARVALGGADPRPAEDLFFGCDCEIGHALSFTSLV